MRTALRIQDSETLFVLEDVAPEYQQAARDLYFQPINTAGGFAKRFPANFPHRQTIFQNFERCAEAMLLQTAGVSSVRWQDGLEDFLNRVEGQGIDWYLVGSAALAVRGMTIAPRDLDIVLVGEADVQHVRDLMLEITVEPFARSENWIAQWFGRTFLHTRLEFVGEIVPGVDDHGICDFGPAAAARLETVEWRGRALRVPPVDLMLAVTEARGLVDRAAEIRRWLAAAERS